MPFVTLFMVINIIIGCYAAIRLGYGPPNWQTAFNQVIRLKTFQDCLNEGRDWLEKKAPWTEKLFNRLRIPKPIIFVDVSIMEEEVEETEEEAEKLEENEENGTDNNIDENKDAVKEETVKEETANEIVSESSGEPAEKPLDSPLASPPVPEQPAP